VGEEAGQFKVTGNAVRGTAEFIRRYKAPLHRTGAEDFILPKGHNLPPWLAVAFETLKLRPASWRVVVLRGKRGATVYRVRWLRWGQQWKRGGRGAKARVVS
jgi:hypothetical protein